MRVLCINDRPIKDQFDSDYLHNIINSLPEEGKSYTVAMQHVRDGEVFYELKELTGLTVAREPNLEDRIQVVYQADCFILLS